MNSLAPIDGKPLRALAMDEARAPLLLLFSSYDPPFADHRAGDVEKLRMAQVNAYMLGLEGLPAWAIEAAVLSFIRGRVDRPARRKGMQPTVEELASEARAHVHQEASRQQVERARLEALAARSSPEFPPEHKARLSFKISVLSAGLALRQVERVKWANDRGLEAMVALAADWKVPVPEIVMKEAGLV